MGFATISDLKLGTMKKAVGWCFDPRDQGDGTVVIQSDKRIARVHLTTGEGLLSDGKGGHQGTWKLSPAAGAVKITVPPSDLERIRMAAQRNPNMKAGEALIVTGERAGQVVG